MKDSRRLVGRVLFLVLCIDLHAKAADPLDQWQVVATVAQSLRGMAYKDGTFVAVGYSTNIVVSTNGSDWFKVGSGLTNGGFYAVAEGAGQFVAVGPGDYRGALVLSSSNGLQWTPRFVHTTEEYWGVTYGGGQFVAVGFHNYGNSTNEATVVLTSIDGLQWERFGFPFQTTPRNVAYGNGVYVAAGAPFSLYSTNGRDWLPLNSLLATSVAYGGGQFIAGSWNGARGTYRSSNGVDWTEVSLPGSPEITFYTAGYANGTFMLAGASEVPGLVVPVVTSTNGIDWMLRTFTNNAQQVAIRDMVFVDGSFYVGDQAGGKIWKSGRMAPSARPAITDVTRRGGVTSLTFTSLPGFRYTVERADHLDAPIWTPWLGPTFATTDNMTVSDSTLNAMQFYRIRTE